MSQVICPRCRLKIALRSDAASPPTSCPRCMAPLASAVPVLDRRRPRRTVRSAVRLVTSRLPGLR